MLKRVFQVSCHGFELEKSRKVGSNEVDGDTPTDAILPHRRNFAIAPKIADDIEMHGLISTKTSEYSPAFLLTPC
jgi:hypothetical protein